MRRQASDPSHRVGTLLVLPAGSGSNLVPLLGLILPAQVLGRFDVVLFDPPGIRSTPPLRCGTTYWERLFGQPITPWVSSYEQVARNCEMDPLFDSIDSAQLAEDVGQLVSALGETQISLLTLWQTSAAASIFAAEHPGRVSAVVYDSPALGSDDFVRRSVDVGEGLERELESYFGRCAARGSECPMGPDPAATWDRLVAQVLGGTGLDGRDSTGLSVIQLQMAARMALMFPTIFDAQLAQGIADAIAGDPAAIHVLVDDYSNRLPDEGSTAYIWNWALKCHDAHPHAVQPGDWEAATVLLARSYPRMGSLAASDYIWSCMLGIDGRDIHTPDWADAWNGTAPPMLVLSSAHDVATPQNWSERFALMLPGAVEATRVGLGSTWSFNRSECTDTVVTEFLVNHATPSDPDICGQA